MELFLVFASGIMSIGLIFIMLLRRPNLIVERGSIVDPDRRAKKVCRHFYDSKYKSVRYWECCRRGGEVE